MPTINFLYSTKKNLLPKTGLLLVGNSIATIDHTREQAESKASEIALSVINSAIVKNITWWFPSGSAFRSVIEIENFAVIEMLKTYGFNIADEVYISNKQVSESNESIDNSFLSGYIELVLFVTEEHYSYLTTKYGNLK